MSFTERLILWLHIGVAIFTIGPATAAIMSTPRYIRKRDTAIVGFLHRITRIYAIGALLVFVLGIALAGMKGDFAKPWISVSMTLFVVAIVLLVLIDRAQGNAVDALKRAAVTAAPAVNLPAVAPAQEVKETKEGEAETKTDEAEAGDSKASPPAAAAASAPADAKDAKDAKDTEDDRIAAVERGRIVSLGGVTSVIWLVILVLMVWSQPL